MFFNRERRGIEQLSPTPDRLGLLSSDYVTVHPPKMDEAEEERVRRFWGRRMRDRADGDIKLKNEIRLESLRRNQFLDQESITKLIPADLVLELLEQGKLYGLSDHDRILYPTYQFDPATRLPYPAIGEMVAMCKGDDPAGWSVHWFAEIPLTDFDGKRTSDVLYSDDPQPGLDQLAAFIERYSDKA